jgi:hypothetical protein
MIIERRQCLVHIHTPIFSGMSRVIAQQAEAQSAAIA